MLLNTKPLIVSGMVPESKKSPSLLQAGREGKNQALITDNVKVMRSFGTMEVEVPNRWVLRVTTRALTDRRQEALHHLARLLSLNPVGNEESG
jgi:hypothetical protein